MIINKHIKKKKKNNKKKDGNFNFNFHFMVNFKSSGFNKGTGGKSGKFQFDCHGCNLFMHRTVA